MGLLSLALVASCSGHDQSLGETRQPPPSIIVVDPAPKPGPDPDPNPPPCEDFSKHALTGVCTPMGECFGHLLSYVGYECPDGGVCCDDTAGAPAPGGGGSGSDMSSGGNGGAGAGGAP